MGQEISTAGGGGIKQRKTKTTSDALDKVLALDAEITQIPECKLPFESKVEMLTSIWI